MNDTSIQNESSLSKPRPFPSAVFLDTCILDSQNYNYSSTVLKSFIPVAATANVKYLLPDPTEREIIRHIKARSDEALKALDDARKKAPFLLKWKHFPSQQSNQFTSWEVRSLATSEWNDFLKNFNVVRLGYSGVNIERIMGWYDNIQAPFKEGKKRKEFPDAFALEILSNYAQKESIVVAIVSEDPDLKIACERFPALLCFPTLPRLTELLLLDHDKINKIKASIKNDLSVLKSMIQTSADDINFYHSDKNIEIGSSDIRSISIWDTNIVAIGDNECTITINALIKSRHRLEWQDSDPYEERIYTYHSNVSIETDVLGTAKVELDPKSMQINNIVFLDLDLVEVEISEDPRY